MSEQRLPFEPESIESMQARLPAALSVAYHEQLLNNPSETSRWPGLSRRHVFDFAGGGRAIVSVQATDHVSGEPLLWVHTSFGVAPGSVLYGLIQELDTAEAVALKLRQLEHAARMMLFANFPGLGAADEVKLTTRALHRWYPYPALWPLPLEVLR